MALSFSGGSSLPAYGTAAYNAAASAPSGQGSYNASTGVLSSGGGVVYSPSPVVAPSTVTGANTAPSAQIQVPSPAQVPNYSGTIAGANAGLIGNGVNLGANNLLTYTPPKQEVNPVDATLKENKSLFDSLMEKIKAPVKTADIYAQERANAGIDTKQQEVQNYTNQINTIVAKANADTLAVTGQGRGIPEVIINGQQAQISKEAAIRVLPIQAQLAAAQGNLALAQQHLDTVFKLKAQDAQSENDYYNKQLEMVYNFATTQEKTKLEALQKNGDRNFSLLTNSINFAQSLSTEAMKGGQASLASSLAQVPPPSVNSPTFAEDLARYNATVSSYQAQVKGKTDSQIIGSMADGYLNVIKDAQGNPISVTPIRGTGIGAGGAGSGVTVTPENKTLISAFNSAVTGMPAGQMKQAQATFNSLISSGDTTGAKEYLARVAVAGAPADQQNQIIGRIQAIDSLNTIDSLLAEAKAKGANTNLISGNIVNVAQKLGTSTNQDLSYIGSRIQQVLQTYRRSMTGVAFGPQEAKEYTKIFPDITNVSSLNTTKLSALTDALNSNNRSALSFYIGGSNYDKIFGKESTTLPSGGGTNLPPVVITPEDNGVFNSIVKPIATKPAAPQIKGLESLGTMEWPSFNFNSFFK